MAAVIQRPLRGSRISTFYPVKNLPSLSSLDSAFQLQEYISLLIRLDVHDVDTIVSLPGSPKSHSDEKEETTKEADKEGKAEVTVDEACWIYEHLRRLAQDLSHPLITTLQQECTRASCPEMKAGEWLYLCVAHGNDGAMEQCCAIDYILHTVDSATALLNSPRTFPSRLQIPQTSHRHFSSLARRLGRIFAHAYFHHREAFEQAEAESSLYARFLALTAKFDLVPAEFLVIPSSHFTGEDSGSDSDREQPSSTDGQPSRPTQSGEEDLQKQQPSAPQTTPQERNASPPGDSGSIGESPASASVSRSRIGRSRTDTMVFTDAEASAVTDELAAKARAGELEPEEEHEAPSTARPAVEEKRPEEELDAGLEEEQFEILQMPEEVMPGAAEESKSAPVVSEPSPTPEAKKPAEAASEKDVTAESTLVHEEETSTAEPAAPTSAPESEEKQLKQSSPEAEHLPEVKEIDFATIHLSAAGEPSTAAQAPEAAPAAAPASKSAELTSEAEPLPAAPLPADSTSTPAAPAPAPEEISAETIPETKKEETPEAVSAMAEDSSAPPEVVPAENIKADTTPAPAEDEIKPPGLEDEPKSTPTEEVKPPATEELVKASVLEEETKPEVKEEASSSEPPVEKVASEPESQPEEAEAVPKGAQ
ncbi:Mob1/phocein [Pholiota conissans]|uniref:Mob1/phocein n=1 Tax=Pholiota conissans TaxID=109636 RepID=A0A9P6D102_9AGAR|nr:Mob1/phocein [Pholiota conissans]